MKLKVFADRGSQPSRAVLILCKANGIEFEEVQIQLAKGEHKSPEYEAINPMEQVPAIEVDGKFRLFESHAILRFLATGFPGIAEHWYPADVFKRAQIDSALDWHHSTIRRGSVGVVLNTTLAPLFGRPLDPQAAAEAEKLLSASLAKIESFWLKGDGPFLLGNSEPSIADLSLVCEIMQLELVDEELQKRILDPYEKVRKWVEDTKKAIQPHFDEIHAAVFQNKEMIKKALAGAGSGETKTS
ncbi:glutathione S-transferase T1-like [Coffea eugenioides]|uniref:glutathione S-transferase T1-like n=1 Tax=Coffea eugenioides TaxID=49369 RepID=UPI000F60C1AA|nr:glutathione S-transferase T1-like [Coffea eugenioides]